MKTQPKSSLFPMASDTLKSSTLWLVACATMAQLPNMIGSTILQAITLATHYTRDIGLKFTLLPTSSNSQAIKNLGLFIL